MAIVVFSYFRAFVIDSISSHHNSFHDKRRGVEVEEQADAEAHCAEILAESGSNSWPMGVPPDRSRKHKVRKHEEIKNRDSTLSWLSAASGKRRFLGMGPCTCRTRGNSFDSHPTATGSSSANTVVHCKRSFASKLSVP